MPFVQIQPKLTGYNPGTIKDKITMGAYLAEGIKRPKHIALRIPRAIIDTTNFVVNERSTMIALHEGVGQDTGFLMLYYNDDMRLGSVASQGNYISKHANGSAEHSNMHAFSVSFRFERFRYYSPNEWPITAVEVNHMIDNGNIVIECPDWFRPNVEKMKEDGLWEEKTPVEEPPPLPLPKLNRSERRALAARVASKLR